VGLRILYVAELVGKAGVFAFKNAIRSLKERYSPDLVVVNADSATGGAGLGMAHAAYLRKLGAEVLLTGEAAFYKKDIVEFMPKAPYLLRPANYPPGVPGRGFRVFQTPSGRVAVLQLLGQAGFARVHLANPFLYADDVLPRLKADSDAVFVEFHAATTAEKRAMRAHLDGRVTALIGAHQKAPTADWETSASGTAYVTDAGRTGATVSVGGLDPATRINEYLTGIPAWSRDPAGKVELRAVVVDAGEGGKAEAIECVRVEAGEVKDD
jgi:hypothetical protein